MRAVVLKTYAKLNLYLNIVGKREDGYHDIDTLMLPISLYDTLKVSRSDEITIITDGKDIPNDDKNIAYVASQAFFKHTGIAGGARILISKHIPTQAGLGGGSTNAAGVLYALNKLYKAELSKQELAAIGKTVGADVPFFTDHGMKRAQGIGEILSKKAYNMKAYFVVVKCFGGVSTAHAYKLLSSFETKPCNAKDIIAHIESGNIEGFAKSAVNMLEPPACELQPNIAEAKSALDKSGSLLSMVTGSGSAVFGVFADRRKAIAAANALKESGKFEFVRFVWGQDATYDELLTLFRQETI